MEQRTKEWFEVRWGRATASRFADIMAVGRAGQPLASRKNYLSQLVIERLTEPPTEDDGYKSPAMEWGIQYEPTAVLEYEMQTGNSVGNAFFEKHPKLMAGASPDGYIGEDGLIEIKCPNSATHLETLQTKAIPKQYIAQVQGQLWITGRKWCDFISYDPRFPANAQLFITRVKRDEKYIKQLTKEVVRFLREVDAETKKVKNFKGVYDEQ